VNAEQSPRAVRVLEKTGFAREGSVALADYASPALASGSLALELWRIARPDASAEVCSQAAFRIGQLARAAGKSESELAARIAGRGDAALRALSAGTRAAYYAVYAHGGASEARSEAEPSEVGMVASAVAETPSPRSGSA
jgi:hypothetical protein